ncbi:MAG: hypothetical protein ABJE95_26475 [Byssovorax sp.]
MMARSDSSARALKHPSHVAFNEALRTCIGKLSVDSGVPHAG